MALISTYNKRCVLLEMILQVSRNPQTGESRGSGYVTMGSINSAKIAIASLDAKVRSLETKKKKETLFLLLR